MHRTTPSRHRGLDLGARPATPLDCARRGGLRNRLVKFEMRTVFKFNSQPRLSLLRVDICCAHRCAVLLQPPLPVLVVNASPAACRPVLAPPPPLDKFCQHLSPRVANTLGTGCRILYRAIVNYDRRDAFCWPPQTISLHLCPLPAPSASCQDARSRPRWAGTTSLSVATMQGRSW